MTLDAERDAMVALALASRPDEHDLRRRLADEHDVELPSFDEALTTLTAKTADGDRVSHRALSHLLLAKVAHRVGFERLARSGTQLADFVDVAVDEKPPHHEPPHPLVESGDEPPTDDEPATDVEPTRPPPTSEPPPSPEPQVPVTGPSQVVVDALRAVAATPEVHPWTTYSTQAHPALSLTPAEVALPLCDDEQDVVVHGHDAIRTIVTWYSPQPVSAFERWTDPRTWPVDCSLFFAAVDEDPPNQIQAGATDFSADFREVVQITSSLALTTPLRFTRTLVPDELAMLAFDFSPGHEAGTEHLEVDMGQVTARHDPYAPPDKQTFCIAEKYIRFKSDALREWPTLLCDLYWTEMAIIMALGCKH